MRLFLSIVIVSLLVACGRGGGNPTSTPANSETATSQEPTSAASTTDAPADDPTHGDREFPEDSARQTAKNSGVWDLVLMDVRVAEHESFDRIVLEFTGTGTPGWAANYLDKTPPSRSGPSRSPTPRAWWSTSLTSAPSVRSG